MSEEKPILSHQDCPHCGHKGCYSIWASGGYLCHSCDAKSSGVTMTTTDRTEEKLKEVSKSYRSISQKALDKYKITTSVSEEDGSDVRRVYPYPHKDKYRYLPKDFSHNKGFTNDHLFGMDKFNAGSSKFLTIVEGEDDAPSAYDMLGCTYPVVALPGASFVQHTSAR